MTQSGTHAKASVWNGGHSPFKVSYGKMMMWFFLLTDALTFSGLLASMGASRFMHDVWPDPNHVFHSVPFFENWNAPLVFVSFMTFVLIVSSVTMVLAVHAGHCNDRKGVIKWMLWTVIRGVVFLACQAWEWTHVNHQGAWWASHPSLQATPVEAVNGYFDFTKPLVEETLANNPEMALSATHEFFNYFFTITGFLGLHVTTGVILNVIVLLNVAFGTYERRGHYEMVEKVGLYWHFVDLVWVFVFTFYYLL